MEPTGTSVTKSNTPRALIFLLISLAILGVVLYTAKSGGYLTTKQTAMEIPAEVVPTQDPNLFMRLEGSTNTTQFSKTENVTLTVVASSSNRDIVGYDTLINFDPAYFDIVSTRTLDTRFQIYAFNKEGMISVTGTKSPSFTGQALLAENDLLSIVLKPKQTGTTTVSIQSTAGPEKTKMVDSSSTVLTPQLTAITLAIY